MIYPYIFWLAFIGYAIAALSLIALTAVLLAWVASPETPSLNRAPTSEIFQ